MTTIDINDIYSLEELNCENNQITSINNIIEAPLLKLNCNNNLLTSLNIQNGKQETLLSFNNNPNLQHICVDSFQQFQVQNLVSNYELLNCVVDLSCPIQGIYIPDINFRTKLLSNSINIDKNKNGVIEIWEALLYTNISVQNGNSIVSLEGLQYFTNLESFSCDHNQITAINLTGLNNLKNLNCSYNVLTSLTLPTSTVLEYLDCSYNSLTSITSPSPNQIAYLACNNNQLTTLDMTNYPNLRNLNCNNNQISSLNLLSNPLLGNLNCDHNQLTALNLSNSNNLIYFNCRFNQIGTLDLSNTKVQGFSCGWNNLISLNVKNNYTGWMQFNDNPNIQYICADSNEISAIQNSIAYYGYTNCVVDSSCVGGNLSNETFAQKELISIYPNPVRDALTIDTTTTISEIMIYNSLGQIVKTIYNVENTKTIDVSNFNSGNYFMKIVTSSGVETQKFIKE